MKKNILIGIIAVFLVVGAVVVWYLVKGRDNSIVVPTSNSSGAVIPNPQGSSNNPVIDKSFSDLYKDLTKAQKDCLTKALGQKKLEGFLKNDTAVMQTITGDEYEKASACPQ